MPKYDYHCETNGLTIEVNHAMNTNINTWGELCSLAGTDPGDTATDTPVNKLLSGSFVSTGSAAAPVPACETPACCGGGACPLD